MKTKLDLYFELKVKYYEKQNSLSELEKKAYLNYLRYLINETNFIDEIDKIKTATAIAFEITPSQIHQKDRGFVFVNARFVFVFFTKLLVDISINKLKKHVKRDHSTVIFYLKEFENRLQIPQFFLGFMNVLVFLEKDYPGICDIANNEIESEKTRNKIQIFFQNF